MVLCRRAMESFLEEDHGKREKTDEMGEDLLVEPLLPGNTNHAPAQIDASVHAHPEFSWAGFLTILHQSESPRGLSKPAALSSLYGPARLQWLDEELVDQGQKIKATIFARIDTEELFSILSPTHTFRLWKSGIIFLLSFN